MNRSAHTVIDPVCDLVGASVTSVHAPDVATIDGVDWSIRAGDYWLLAAWPDSGKRDLLCTLAGLQRPVAGRCIVLGHDLYRADATSLLELRHRIGLVYDDGGRLFNDLSLAENIALPVAYHSNRSLVEVLPEIEPLLPLMDLSPFAHLLPAQVGRAWRQRAALARALAMKPEILLLIDPVAGLDGRHVRWWRDFLAQLNIGHAFFDQRPLTLIVAKDDLRDGADHARQFAIIKQRRLITYRTREELAAKERSLFQELDGVAAHQEAVKSKA